MSDDERLDPEQQHAPLGPSRAEGWATCSDYVNANAGLPDVPTKPAAEGSVAHVISDLCVLHGFDAADFIDGRTKMFDWTFVWTEEDAQLLQPGIDRLRRFGVPIFGERRVDISSWTRPGQFGTLDRGWWTSKAIYVEDLKWGRVPVYAYRLLQLILYALGFWNDIARHHTSATRFVLSIDQPRCAGGGGVWETDLDELLAAGAWLLERAKLTMQPNPPRQASEKACVWCKRRVAPGGCDTFERFNTALLGVTPEALEYEIVMDNPLPLVPASAMTPERRSFILQHRKMLENWLDRLEETELADYMAGLPTPGRKAVDDTRKGTRTTWRDEVAASAALAPFLGVDRFIQKLKTPKQISKLISPEVYQKLVPHIQPGEAGKSMVPLEDTRPAIAVVTANDFDDLLD